MKTENETKGWKHLILNQNVRVLTQIRDYYASALILGSLWSPSRVQRNLVLGVCGYVHG